LGRPENGERLHSWARANPPDGTRQTAVALEEAEDVPSDSVFRVLVPHARLTLSSQDHFKTLTIIRFYPEKVPKGVVINVSQTTAIGMNLDSVRQTGACLGTTTHGTSLKTSVAKFRNSKRHVPVEHAPNYTASMASEA
jgi:hypothetical protein